MDLHPKYFHYKSFEMGVNFCTPTQYMYSNIKGTFDTRNGYYIRKNEQRLLRMEEAGMK